MFHRGGKQFVFFKLAFLFIFSNVATRNFSQQTQLMMCASRFSVASLLFHLGEKFLETSSCGESSVVVQLI